MISDAERREVAQKLRKYASWDEDGELVGCTEFGESVLNLLSCGDTERECFNALADLIEPSCDRDALLELADDLERMGDGSMYDASISDEYGIARRIREALGVYE